MTTSITQPKWALIGVRVCAVYLALWAIAGLWMLFTVTYQGFGWLLSIFFISSAMLLSVTAIKLWQLRPWGRIGASALFVCHIGMPVLLFFNLLTFQSSITLGDLMYGTMLAVIGIIGWVLLNRPTVKALFENQQSKI
jgi:hypothetical protein